MKRQRRTSKWVIAAALQIVEDWAAGNPVEVTPLISAVKEYEPEYFFQAYKRGYEKALKARVAAGKS